MIRVRLVLAGVRVCVGGVALWLAGCGGGGGGGGAAGDDPSASVMQGTAAVGKPISGGTLALKCVNGERTGTTGSDGRYQVDLSGLTLPCLVSVSGGQVGETDSAWAMSSVLVSPGVTNVTPWTHLVAARLLRADPQSLSALSSQDLRAQLTPDKVSQAQEGVRLELARLLGTPPAAEIDALSTAFVAEPGNGMDDLLEQIMSGLRWTAKTLPQAAQEIAVGSLKVKEVPSNCRPSVLTGFVGGFNDVMVQVPFDPLGNPGNDAGGGGDSGGSGGGEGAGVGGSLGQFLNVTVRVERMDGSLLGEAQTDSVKGLVTLVPCRYQGPVRVTVKAKADGSSRYFEESTGQYAAFAAGEEMNAVVPSVDKNIGVTLLTEAAWQYLLAKHGPSGWKSAANVVEANAVIQAEFNKYLPKGFQLTDLTRLPYLVGGGTTAGSLDTSPNGLYGIVSSGLARVAGLMRSADLAPALKLVRQFGRDLCDGVIDLSCKGEPVVADAKDAAYLPAQFGETLNRGVGDVAAGCGTAAAEAASFRVTQMAIDAVNVNDPVTGKVYWALAYHDKQPIYLLRSDGKAFSWPERAKPAQALMPEFSFNRIFPQVRYKFAGLLADGRFAALEGPDATRSFHPGYDGATTTAGFSTYDYLWADTQIVRLANGRVSYYPHFESEPYGQAEPITKEATLGNVVSVSVASGQGPTEFGNPSFYAVTAAGAAYAWGNQAHGALANGRSDDGSVRKTGQPQQISGLPPVAQVVGRESGAFAVDREGKVWAWGRLTPQGLLSGKSGIATDVLSPMVLRDFDAVGPVRQISCGVQQVCVGLTRQGKLLAWGRFGFQDGRAPAELQVPYRDFAVTEVPLPAGRKATYVGASHYMIYGVLDDGSLVVFPSYPTTPKFLDVRSVLPSGLGSSSAPTCRRP